MDEKDTLPRPAAVPAVDALLEAQRDVLEMIVRRVPLRTTLDALCRIVEAHTSAGARAAIMLLDEQRTLWTAAAPSLPADYTRAVDGIKAAPGIGTCAQAAALGTIVVTDDIASDPAWTGLAQLPLDLGLRAAWSAPIVSSVSTVLGTFGTYFEEPRQPEPHERRLVEVLARTAALAIERERSDDALRASESRYRAIVETSPECVKLVARDGTLLQINAAGLKLVGAAREEDVLGGSVYDLIAPEHRARFRSFNERICAGGRGTLEFEIIDRDGGRRSVETTAVPLSWAGHEFAHLAITRDVTARTTTERSLAQSRSRLDYAARIAGVGFWYCDLPFDELVWDERVKAHFFFPADARITIESFFERIHPDDREPTRIAIDRAINARTSYDVLYRTVDPVTAAVKWIHAVGAAAYGADGKPTSFDGVTLDVTARKLDEQRLAALNDRLREQDRRKDEFLATLAHELRNPLAPLSAGLEILDLGGDASGIDRTRAMMSRQLRHLVRLVDDLLDISRITLGKVALRKRRIDFRDVIESAIETTRPLIEARGQTLDVRLPEQALPLDADAARLAQVAANVLNNSAKFTPAGGRIEISVERAGAEAMAWFRDTGAGISSEMLPRIFDLFTQGEAGDVAGEGLGVGLTLARSLMEMHGGSIEAGSAGLEQGSTFVLTLPLALGHSDMDDKQGIEEMANASKLRILVVDDNVDAAESLSTLLEFSGHQTLIAHSGEEALERVVAFAPEVAFVDIGLPGLNGYEVAERIRRNPQIRPDLRLVALTGWGADEDRRRAKEAGFDEHLVKPASLNQVRATLTGAD